MVRSRLLSVLENIVSEVYDDDEEINIEDLKPIRDVEKLRPELAKAAQKIYDEWEQDEEGYSEEVGGGGICHLIADELIDVLSKKDIPSVTISCSHEVHVYIVVLVEEGIYQVDIRPHVYETGGGYSWKKIPDVEFESGDIIVEMISGDHNDWKDYLED